MKKLNDNLQDFLKTDIDLYSLSQILLDEEYIDTDKNPLMCLYCNNEEFTKYHKIDIQEIEKKYQEQILEIYPDIENSIITFWVCNSCDSVVAIKLYSHKSRKEKKIYYHKFDSFNQIIKDLKQKSYLEKNNEPCKCWYCQSDKIEIREKEDRNVAICQDCKKVLGFEFDNAWRILVENER